MSLVYTNNAQSLLASAIDSSALTITLQEADGRLFPDISEEDGDWFPLTLINPDDSAYEIVRATARDGDTITILRAQENTPVARQFSEGAVVSLRMSAAGYDEFIKSGSEKLTVELGINLAIQTNTIYEPYKIFLEDIKELKDGLVVRFRPTIQIVSEQVPCQYLYSLNQFRVSGQVYKAASRRSQQRHLAMGGGRFSGRCCYTPFSGHEANGWMVPVISPSTQVRICWA